VDLPVTRRSVHRLASWRMFANEAASVDALVPEFAAFASEVAHEQVYERMARRRTMRPAGDEFYYGQRMRRWGGITETAVCFDRSVANPMLDKRFLDIARGLPPALKANSRFLARLQMALDPVLGAVPMDGRPAPSTYTARSVSNSASQLRSLGRKAIRKAKQRLSGSRRPPAGGQVLAAKLIEHWRSTGGPIGVEDFGVFRPEWLARLRSEATQIEPATAALLVNLELLAATGAGEIN
jgi:asparagine synthase (glutamine-hydrolysing)